MESTSQVEQVRHDNRGRWQNAAIVMLVLLITGIGVPLIPVVALYTVIATRRAEREAEGGVYGTPHAERSRVDDKSLNYWIGALALIGFGVFFCWAGLAIGADDLGSGAFWAVVGLALVGGGVAMRPWRRRVLKTS